MTRDRNDGTEFTNGRIPKSVVLPDLLECLCHEIDWNRKTLCFQMQKYGVQKGPKIWTVDKVFQNGYATDWVYAKMRLAIKDELARRHASNDTAIHIDPKIVPMIDHLNRWPSEELKKRHFKRKKEAAEAERKRNRLKQKRQKTSS